MNDEPSFLRMELGPQSVDESPMHRQLYVDGKSIAPEKAADICDINLALMDSKQKPNAP